MAWRMSWRRVWVWWLTVSFALALLLSFTDSEVTQGLGLLPAFALWFAHVSVGLLLAVLCVRGLAKVRALARLPALVQLLLGGLIGSVLFAPLAFGIESLWPPEGEEIVDGFLDEWERAGGALAVVAEWLRLAPQYLSSWALLNLPPLLASQRPELNHPQDPPRSDEPRSIPVAPDAQAATSPVVPAPDLVSRAIETAPDPSHTPASPRAQGDPRPHPPTPQPAAAEAATDASSTPLLDRIPPAIGRQLVVVQSDLHYLLVRSTRGTATVLGSIAELESELGDRGLRVHRSFWVAVDQVRKVRRTARGWFCIMSDQSKVPISRRRIATVKERIGVDFVVNDDLSQGG